MPRPCAPFHPPSPATCAFCRRALEPKYAALWGPDAPDGTGVTTRLARCATRGTWRWAVLDGGVVVATGEGPSEAQAVADLQAAARDMGDGA